MILILMIMMTNNNKMNKMTKMTNNNKMNKMTKMTNLKIL